MALDLYQLNGLVERLQYTLDMLEDELVLPIEGPMFPLPVPHRYSLQAPPFGLNTVRPRPAVGIVVSADKVALKLHDLLRSDETETHFTGPRKRGELEWETLVGLGQYFLVQNEEGRLEEFKNVVRAAWNITEVGYDTIIQVVEEVHREQEFISQRHLQLLRNVHHGILILGGSVGAKVSLRDSDFDYSTPNPLGRMADRRQSMYNAFTGDYDIKSCWGSKNAQANIPMLHVTGIDRRSRYSCSIDFSSTTHIGPLALELSGLPLKERIIIIAAKLFFKKLHLIYRNRLTSSSFAVAYLCFRKDVNTLERSFGKFMAYYAGFDFHRYRMTSNGPKLKPLPGATYEAYDIHALNAANRNFNTLASTPPEIMDIAKEWMYILSAVPGIINLIVAMF